MTLSASLPVKPLLFCVLLALAGCDSAEERAESHYQNAVKLVAEGQIEKALVELRTVFDLNGEHLAARMEYARLLTERGELEPAVSQYLRVLEQAPDNRPARLAVGKAMLQFGAFEEAEKHANRLLQADAGDAEGKAILATALMQLGKPAEAVAIANELLAGDPHNVTGQMILISDDMSQGRVEQALKRADAAIIASSDELGFYLTKLAILERAQNSAEITGLLEQMAARFPDNEQITQARVAWMLETGDDAGAETLLRQIAAADPADVTAALDVVALLERTKGLEAAQTELATLAARDGANKQAFGRALATMQHRRDDAPAALALVQALQAAASTADDIRENNVLLAFFQYDTGEKDEASALVDSVLAEDATNIRALKLRAQISIDRDDYEKAIADLRTAFGADPHDASILVLEATAHDLNGAPELARERLAEAVNVSGAEPSVTLEYTRYLVAEGKMDIAEAALQESAQRHPMDRQILLALADLRLSREDWAGADFVARQLRTLSDDDSDPAADMISAAVLAGRNEIEQSIGLMNTLLGSGDARQDDTMMMNIVRTHLVAGDVPAAEMFLNDILARKPGDYTASLLLAGLYAVSDRLQEAEALYRELVTANPAEAGAYVMLASLLGRTGRGDDSAAVTELGLKNAGDTARLEFLRATQLEALGDFEGAIAIYEKLHELTPGSELLANNLASLLSEHRTDQVSLDKAFQVAKRLRGSEFPPFQDTYAWVQYLRGDYEMALAGLLKAEEPLGENPIYQFHLGMTQLRLGQNEAATAALEKAVALAGAASLTNLPQIGLAKAELAKLRSGSN